MIRPARAADEPALARVDAQTWSPQSSPGPPPCGPFFDADCAPEDVLVALDADRVVGYVRLTGTPALASHAHVLTVNGLGVLPEARGRGLGRQLLQSAVALARSRGARKVALRVLAGNAVARSLYASCGFQVEGVLREEFLLEGTYVDDVLMGRQLG